MVGSFLPVLDADSKQPQVLTPILLSFSPCLVLTLGFLSFFTCFLLTPTNPRSCLIGFTFFFFLFFCFSLKFLWEFWPASQWLYRSKFTCHLHTYSFVLRYLPHSSWYPFPSPNPGIFIDRCALFPLFTQSWGSYPLFFTFRNFYFVFSFWVCFLIWQIE